MNTINLHKPGELDASVNFPSSWDELLPEEIFAIAKLILSAPANDIEAKASLLLTIIKNRVKLQKIRMPKNWQSLLDAENLVTDMFPLLSFIYDENVLTKLPIKTLHLKATHSYEVHGPEKGFESLTCGEFEAAEPHFHDFVDKPNIESIAKLCAIIFRERHKKFYTKDKDDVLVPYDYERWVKLFEKVEEYKLYAIFIWYSGCRNALQKYFPTVHEPSDEDRTETNPKMQFTNCIHAAAGPKNGTRDNIRMMQLLELYNDMEQEAIKAKELKAMYDKQ